MDWKSLDNREKSKYGYSEVIYEYEKLISKATHSLHDRVKEAQQQEISKKLDTINKGVENTSKELGSFLDLAKNLADDEQPQEEQVPDPKKEEQLLKDKQAEQLEAREKLVQELNELVVKASEDGDFKLVYKIERSIDSLLYEE